MRSGRDGRALEISGCIPAEWASAGKVRRSYPQERFRGPTNGDTPGNNGPMIGLWGSGGGEAAEFEVYDCGGVGVGVFVAGGDHGGDFLVDLVEALVDAV